MLDNLLTKNLIQLQVECKQSANPYECCTCSESFEMPDARVIACNSQGDRYGDVCATCISKGFSWIANRLQNYKLLQLS